MALLHLVHLWGLCKARCMREISGTLSWVLSSFPETVWLSLYFLRQGHYLPGTVFPIISTLDSLKNAVVAAVYVSLLNHFPVCKAISDSGEKELSTKKISCRSF